MLVMNAVHPTRLLHLTKRNMCEKGMQVGCVALCVIISTVTPLNARSSSKRRHDRDRYGSHIVSRIAKLLFCFLFIEQGLARRDKRAHGRERGERVNGKVSYMHFKLFRPPYACTVYVVSVVRGRVQNRRIAARQIRAGGSVSLHPPEGDQRNCCR